MEVHQLSVTDALTSLRSTERGLASAEAARRLQEFGPNRLEKVAQESLGLRFLKEFFGFFSVILWIAAALAFLGEAFDRGQGMAHVGYAIVIVILVSGAFSFWQDYRVDRALAALEKLLPQEVQVVRDGAVAQVAADRLVPGDVILLEQGSIVPADCRLMESSRFRVSDAHLTGESLPRARDPAPSPDEDLRRSRNVLLAGSSVLSGRARAVVFATGAQTEFGRVARLTQATEKEVSPLRRELAHLSRLIALLAVAIGSVFFAIGAILGVPFWRDFIFSIGIIVAMVPEGLLPTLTLALVLAARRMSRRNVLVRHLSSVEALGSATVICSDKTGTLTENRMRAREMLLGVEEQAPLPASNLQELAERHPELFRAAFQCHEVRATVNGGSRVLVGDPTEVALLEMAEQAFPGLSPMRRLDEISFDERMRHSVVCETPHGPVVYCKGAPESLLPLCARTYDGGQVRRLDPEALGKIDPEEYLIISDRSKDLVKSGGEWISSVDLENHIVALDGVAQACVVGRPHPKWDERPIALVVKKPGGEVSTKQVIDHCAGQFAKWQLPDDVLFVDTIPLTSTGKMDKKTVRAQLDAKGYELPDLRKG